MVIVMMMAIKGSAANETEKWNKKKLENIKRYKGHLADIASYGGITGSSLGKKMTNYDKSSYHMD